MFNLSKLFPTIRNKKFNNGLEEAVIKSNKIHSKKSNAVVCIYCGKWLEKDEAAAVYDIEKTIMEYSHEECWQANNEVSDTMPIAK
jgi:hypothetical protein